MIPKTDLRIETMRGTGPGGQRRNKVETAVRITHIPTGVTAYADERSQQHSRKVAMQELEQRLKNIKQEKKAAEKKARRDYNIHNMETIRTYNYDRGLVKDHRNGKTASVKDVLVKGKIDLLR